ncbi:MAG: SRPBCC domain-containing protein [Alphaproteobacteria bacterium]|nr:SRPBCC domain-containing protein [Alphaproteobacteria bacterium]
MAGVKIEHRIGVKAPAEAIWEIISDIEGWEAWNTLYPKARGALRIGGALELEVALPGQPRRAIRPVILDWVPNDQIHWRLSMFGGLVRTVRYLEIEALSESGCIFSNGEIFDGWLGPLIARQVGGAARQGFTTMGEAVKALAEAKVR